MGTGDSKKLEAHYHTCLAPFDAVKRLLSAGLEDREHAINWLAARLHSGEIHAIGEDCTFVKDEAGNFQIGEEIFVLHSFKVWKNIHAIHWKHDFWISGSYSDQDDGGFEQKVFKPFQVVSNVRFDPSLIDQFCKRADPIPIPSVQIPAKVAKQPGGRPPKPIWDELWSRISAQLYNGDLKPERQADLERAMQQALIDLGSDAGETTIRRKAKMLWEAIQAEDQNSD